MMVPNTEQYQTLPKHMRPGMRDYIERGILPGRFLQAILSNDFITAYGRADHINRFALHDFARFLDRWAPRECYGSPEKVAAWSKRGGLNVASRPGAVEGGGV